MKHSQTPMPLGNGKFMQPTGKAFKLPMCTIGHWKDGIMNEEWFLIVYHSYSETI